MATMNDIMTGAARRIGVIQAGGALSAPVGADFLENLNDLMSSFPGLDIGFTAALLSGDEFPLEFKHEAGMKTLLAVRIADGYGKPVSVELAGEAAAAWQRLQADYLIVDPVQMPRALLNMPSQRRSRVGRC